LMFRLKSLAASAAVGAALLAAPAFAGGLTEPILEPVVQAAPPPMDTGGDWTGAYVGAGLSYGDLSAGADGGNGALYGVRAGYDYDFGKFVLGAGLDYDAADVDLDSGAGSLDSVLRLKVRGGIDLGQTLVYATAGAARAEATLGGARRGEDGYFGGIGADYMLNDRWTLGGEVLIHKFDNFGGTGTDIDATTAGVNVGFRF
jgi:outer membrane immunogenic protein